MVFGFASQLSKLWRNDSGSTGKQKTVACDTFKTGITQYGGWRYACVNGVTGIEIGKQKHAFVLNNIDKKHNFTHVSIGQY